MSFKKSIGDNGTMIRIYDLWGDLDHGIDADFVLPRHFLVPVKKLAGVCRNRRSRAFGTALQHPVPDAEETFGSFV